MNFFKKLFGISDAENPLAVKDDYTLAYEKSNEAECIPPKFMFMVITETSGESPKMDDVYEIIDTSFPECPRNMGLTLSVQVMAMQKIANNNPNEWQKIYKNFFSQLERLDLEKRKKILTEIAEMGFSLKNIDDMVDIAQKYVYRMQIAEDFLGFSKEEYINLLETSKKQINEQSITSSGTNNKKTTQQKINHNIPQGDSDGYPHYIVKAQEELAKASTQLKLTWEKYAIQLEDLLKRSSATKEDLQSIDTILKHALHKNYGLIDFVKLKTIYSKYFLMSNPHNKGHFKKAENSAEIDLKKWQEVNNKIKPMIEAYKRKNK